MNTMSDSQLFMLATERTKNLRSEDFISQEEILSSLGITQEELDAMDDVTFE